MLIIDQNNVILLILFVLCILIGYILGKLNGGVLYTSTKNSKKEIGLLDIKNKIEPIKIDEKKVVTDIDTKSLEKKFDNLGEVVVSSGDINSSINKLKNIKR